MLRAMRFAHSLAASPLVALDLVTVRLCTEGLADTAQSRAWALGQCVELAVTECLAELRCGDAGPASPPTAPDGVLAILREDLRSASDARLNVALLQARYLSTVQLSASTMAAGLGLALRTVHYRVARGIDVVADRLRSAERAAARHRASQPAGRPHERIVVTERARQRTAPELLDELLAALRHPQQSVRVTRQQLATVACHPAAEWLTYRLGRIAAWSDPRYQLDERFVNLTLLVDMGEASSSGRWQPKDQRFGDLRDVLAAVAEPAVVVLGPPGSGKSTLLRRLELDLAVEALTADSDVIPAQVTFLVSLNQYAAAAPGGALPEPRAWLIERWATRCPALPPLDMLLSQGRMVLLLDGLNEMPHRSAEDHRERVLAWKHFLHNHVAAVPGNRLVIACRSLDYSAPLSTPRLQVPQVQVEPLADVQVRAFLERYSPGDAAALWAGIAGTAVLEAVRWPFFLRLLVEHAADGRDATGDLAELFTGFVRRALAREIERDNPLFAPGMLLSARDVQRVTQRHGRRSGWDLPEGGALFPALARLAFRMQQTTPAEEMSQVRIGYETALAHLGADHGPAVVQGGAALGLLEEDRGADEVMFGHQLVQEYFAARQLVRESRPELVGAPWRTVDIRPDLRDHLDTSSPAEPLPALPTSGWDETAVMAASMTAQPEPYLRSLMDHHLVLAGRAANVPGVRARLSEAFLVELRWALESRSRDAAADIRARIDAGLALGRLGDPRFRRRVGPHGAYLEPPLVAIPGGAYPIGDDDVIEGFGLEQSDHVPRHMVQLAPFAIGRFPVTNAEWACFMATGGYDDPRWWTTPDGQAWRRGEGTAAAHRDKLAWQLDGLRARPGLVEEYFKSGLWTEAYYVRYTHLLSLDESDLRDYLHAHYPDGPLRAPHYWADARYNNPSQPVIGVCWYEALAYGAWLTAQTGRPFRLPSEVEHEAAQRGREGRRWAYGDAFDPLAANTLALRLHRTSPVGVCVTGDTPEGASDLCGNVAEWTLSVWGMTVDDPYPYPYRADDGREDVLANAQQERVARGGHHRSARDFSRSVVRDHNWPGVRALAYYGFRLCMPMPD